jgi:hypothetical protein
VSVPRLRLLFPGDPVTFTSSYMGVHHGQIGILSKKRYIPPRQQPRKGRGQGQRRGGKGKDKVRKTDSTHPTTFHAGRA